MVDDSSRNLRPALAVGMKTVLLSRNGAAPVSWVDAAVPSLESLPAVLANLARETAGSRSRRVPTAGDVARP